MNKKISGANGNHFKMAVLFHRVGPYHFARLEAAAQQMRVAVVEYSNVDSFYAWDEVTGQAGFERVTLFSGVPVEQQSAETITARVQVVLTELQPQVVFIPGWSGKAVFVALRWCVQNNIPAVAMSESTEWDEPRMTWKEWVKQRIVGMYSAALVGGTPHKDYMVKLGMPPERIFLGYDVVGNGYFGDKVAEIRSQKPEVRKRHGLPENYFLASARFIEKKNLRRLIGAYVRYRELAGKSEIGNRKSEVWKLVLLGDGKLRSDLCRLISYFTLQDFVLLPGFKQYSDLPAYYGLANAFIHASTTEQWGLVVNEAMASGLPVLVSNRCGCATDLVQEGVNGFTFDPCDVEQLAQYMLRISDSRFPISESGTASLRIISNWGPERFASGMRQAATTALAARLPELKMSTRFMLAILSRRRTVYK